MNSKSYHYFFMNLGNKTKLGIILALKNKNMNVSEIVSYLKEEQSNISHHLKDLILCRIVDAKQVGKQRIYSLNKRTVLPILKLVEKHSKLNCSRGCNKPCPGCC